ncbi:thiamine pyrophosphate-binding protein [Chloroflexota bacterium]
MSTEDMTLTAKVILDELQKCGISHVVWLPASETFFMYEALISRPELKLVQVCREGEAIAIAAGLMIGGKNPVVWHQNTGFFESGDSIRGLALDLDLPLLMLIGYRGWRYGSPLTDSAAIYLEPLLNSWGIKHHLVETDEDAGKISDAYKEAHETQKPVAILIGAECIQP